MTCTCGKCTYCDVQKCQDLYKSCTTLVEYHSCLSSCKEAITYHDQNVWNEKKQMYWKRKYSKLYDKLSLFHYHFDKDFDLPSHYGFEGRVFVNNEIEVDAKDFKEILEFIDLYQSPSKIFQLQI